MPRKTLTLIGIILILSEISGLPHQWKTTYGIIAGALLVFIAFRRAAASPADSRSNENEDSSFKKVMTGVGQRSNAGSQEGQDQG